MSLIVRVISEPVVQTFSERVYPGGLTYSGHPLACAAAVATITAMEEEGIVYWFEFEGDAASKLAKRFGLEAEKAEKLSYLELYQAHRRENPTAPKEMVFS